MLNFLRRFRRNQLSSNKSSQYLSYAIGEIALVMIGILLALQINNWNQKRQENNKIRGFYSSIVDEIDVNIKGGNQYLKRDSQLMVSHRRALNIIDQRQVDSLEVLKKMLGSTATVWGNDYSFPASEEFLSLDFLPKISDPKIRENFTTFSYYLERVQSGNEYNTNQYTNSIEPFFVEHINYTEVALERYSKYLVKGGPKTDFEALFDNLELWNIVTFKLETLANSRGGVRRFLDFLELHKSDLQTALKES